MKKYRDVLKTLDDLEEKRRAQDALYVELRRSILAEATERNELERRPGYLHVGNEQTPIHLPPGTTCSVCHTGFRKGEHIFEYLDDGKIVATYHARCH